MTGTLRALTRVLFSLVFDDFYFVSLGDEEEVDHLKDSESTDDKYGHEPVLLAELSGLPEGEALPHEAPCDDDSHHLGISVHPFNHLVIIL